ncbi:hypothetical protein ACFVT2_36215 [Streptomyces sp. NPDC058000]|uniref:hypothetical protein n=1 Tax=Streptomyces sp. NPDC058000 TaxID=3346299 RepID=UPI0036E64CAA
MQRAQILVLCPDFKPTRRFHENANGCGQEGLVVSDQTAFDEGPSIAMPGAEQVATLVHDDRTDHDLGATIFMDAASLKAVTAKCVEKQVELRPFNCTVPRIPVQFTDDRCGIH